MKTLREILTESPTACEDGLEWACNNSGATNMAELWDKLERADWMLWIYRFKKPAHKIDDITLRQFALDCAVSVLPIFEAKYPNDKRPRECCEAVALFLDGKITLSELRLKSAAAAAYAAARKQQADKLRSMTGNPWREDK